MTPIDPALAVLFLAAGGALGATYFLLLWATVRLYAAQGSTAVLIGLYLLRFGLAGAGFWFAARQGALPLLLVLGGFIAARYAVQRWTRTA